MVIMLYFVTMQNERKDIMIPTPDRLRLLRGKTGLLQSEVAQKLNIPTATYSSYENGSNPKPEMLVQLATFFSTTSDYLLGLSNDMKPASDKLSTQFTALAKRGCSIISASDIADFIGTVLRYMRSGSPCGDIPLHAWHDFTVKLCETMDASVSGDSASMIDNATAAAVAALNVTKMPAAFYELKEGTEP